jgi:hypothetical protein
VGLRKTPRRSTRNSHPVTGKGGVFVRRQKPPSPPRQPPNLHRARLNKYNDAILLGLAYATIVISDGRRGRSREARLLLLEIGTNIFGDSVYSSMMRSAGPPGRSTPVPRPDVRDAAPVRRRRDQGVRRDAVRTPSSNVAAAPANPAGDAGAGSPARASP